MDPTQNNVFGNQPPINAGGSGVPVNPGAPMGSGVPMNSGVPMGSGVPMNLGTGDITLAGNEKKSKKWWIVALLALFVVAIVGGIVWYFVARPNGQGVFVGDTKTLFEEFENYMLIGENDDTDIDSENDDDAANEEAVTSKNAFFVGVTRLGNYEEQKRFFSKAKEYVSGLKASTNDAILLSTIGRMDDMISVTEQLSAVSYTDHILQEYLRSGDNGIEDYLEGIKNQTTNSSYSSMLNNIEALILKQKQLFGYYMKSGCIVNDSLDSNCVSTVLKSNKEVGQLSDGIQVLTHNNRENLNYLNRSVFDGIEEMRGLIE